MARNDYLVSDVVVVENGVLNGNKSTCCAVSVCKIVRVVVVVYTVGVQEITEGSNIMN